MLQRCIFIFLLSLPLLGCKTEIWRLEFEAPVRVDASVKLSESTLEIKGAYLEAIRSILAKHHLDPLDFRFRHHQTVEGTIFVSGNRGSIPEEAFAGVERDFQEVLAARNKGFSATLEFPDDLKELTGSALWRQRYAFNYRISALFAYSEVNPLLALIFNPYGAMSSEHDFFCAARADITRTFPFHDLEFPAGSLSGQAVITSEKGENLTVPVRLTFAEPSFDALLQDAGATVTIDNPTRTGAVSMVLEFATLGRQFLGDLDTLDEACQQQAAAMGRPFSFAYGEGLDRLVKFQTL